MKIVRRECGENEKVVRKKLEKSVTRDLKMRREPQQARSQERIDRILIAAEQLIVEKGLAELSVREVARRTETNIATFYQFFPNRAALVRRIVEMHQAGLAETIEGAISESEGADIRTAIATLQSRTLAFYKSNPVVTEIWPGTHADHTLRAVNQADNQANIQRIAQLVRSLKPDIEAEAARKAALLILITTAPVIRHCVTLPPEITEGVLEMHLDQVVFTISSL